MGIENPEEVVPQLLSVMENQEGKTRDKTQQVLNDISDQVDLIDILIKIPFVKTLWTGTDPDDSVYCVDIGSLNGIDVVAAGSGKAFGSSKENNVYLWNSNGKILWQGRRKYEHR